jgi:hypothetical protein
MQRLCFCSRATLQSNEANQAGNSLSGLLQTVVRLVFVAAFPTFPLAPYFSARGSRPESFQFPGL